ncbi:MAG: LptF/LptG family permease [Thermoanaerobaculia bacterium]|nr:LptF/LptG family permease [Thermoanaerobaculia bacterium]
MHYVRRLDRYAVSEILGPLLLGFLIYTFIILAQFLLQSAEMIVRRGVPAPMVGKLLALSLPNIVVITIPMSFLFAILVAIGRLSADSELVAMRASGVSLLSLYRPVLLLSLVLAILNTYLMLTLLPAGNHALQRLRIDIVTESINKQVEPRVFYDEWPGFMLYVWESPPEQELWQGVFLAETKPGQDAQMTVADHGQVHVDETGERILLELQQATTHRVDLDKPDKYHIIHHRTLERLVEDRFASTQRAKVSASKGLREKTIPELQRDIADPDFPEQLRNLARVEIHKKFSLPAACLVFGLIALPMGFGSRRGASKSTSFALSIVIILFYWVVINNGEEAARVGKIPAWLAMWLPNIVLAAFGFYLLARRNSDKSLMLRNIDRWMQRHVWTRLARLRERRQQRSRERGRAASTAAASADATESDEKASSTSLSAPHRVHPPDRQLVLRLPRFQWWSPSLLDSYVAKLFTRVGLLVMLSMLVVFIVGDLTEIADDLLNNQVPGETVFRYYRYLSLQMLYELAPVVVLVTTLVVFGLLSRTNEVIACRAVGISLYRLSIPVLVCSAILALGCFYLQAEVLPTTNRKVARIKDQIKGREQPRIYRRADRQWLYGQGRYIYYFQTYDPSDKSLTRLQVLEFDPEIELVRRLYVSEATYLGEGRWRFESGWTRRFDGNRVVEYRKFDQPVVDRFPETPEYFESDLKPPEQMSYRELDDYIRDLERSGQQVPEMKTDLHAKVAYPAATVVMALVALPFAFRLGRKGALYGLGLSVVLGMVFIAIYHFFTTLGQTGALPPLLAVWAPSIAFTVLSIYLFLGVRT